MVETIYNYEPIEVKTLKEFVKKTALNRDYLDIKESEKNILTLQGYYSKIFKSGESEIEKKQLIQISISGHIQTYPYTEPFKALCIHWPARNVYTLLAHKFEHLHIIYYLNNDSIMFDELGIKNETLHFKAQNRNKSTHQLNTKYEIEISAITQNKYYTNKKRFGYNPE